MRLIVKIILVVNLVPWSFSEIIRGKCPTIVTTQNMVNFTKPNLSVPFTAIFTVPKGTPSEDFDFYLAEEEVVKDNAYSFHRNQDFLYWDYTYNGCLYNPAIRFKDNAYEKGVFLVHGDNSSVLCESNTWIRTVIITDDMYPNVLLVLSCRELNYSHSDLVAWVLLEVNDFLGHFTTGNVKFYSNLAGRLFKLSGLNMSNFKILTLPPDSVLQELRKDNPLSNCYSNICKTKTYIHKFHFLHIIWTICGLFFGAILILAMEVI